MESSSKTKKVPIYRRVATQRQNENTALALQEKVWRAFCVEHGLTVLKGVVFAPRSEQDAGFTAKEQ